MVEEKQIYVYFEKENYKENKEVLLKAQIDFINLQKRIHLLKAIRSKKKRLLEELNKGFSKINFVVERLDTRLPDEKLPSGVKKLITKKKEKKNILKEKTIPEHKIKNNEKVEQEDMYNLDKELMEIQSRLRELQG